MAQPGLHGVGTTGRGTRRSDQRTFRSRKGMPRAATPPMTATRRVDAAPEPEPPPGAEAPAPEGAGRRGPNGSGKLGAGARPLRARRCVDELCDVVWISVDADADAVLDADDELTVVLVVPDANAVACTCSTIAPPAARACAVAVARRGPARGGAAAWTLRCWATIPRGSSGRADTISAGVGTVRTSVPAGGDAGALAGSIVAAGPSSAGGAGTTGAGAGAALLPPPPGDGAGEGGTVGGGTVGG